MKRYFFHVPVEDRPFDDISGLPMDSDDAAVEVADRIANELVEEDDERLYQIKVVDPQGETIAQIESTPPSGG